MDSKIIIILVVLGMVMIGTALIYPRIAAVGSSSGSSSGSGGSGDGGGDTGPPPAIYYYYVVVEGYFDSSSGDGHISSIYVDVTGIAIQESQPLGIGEGADHVDIMVYYNGELVKSKSEDIGSGNFKVYLDVTELKGKTVTVKAQLIDERIGAYGIPQPVVVDEKEAQLIIQSHS